MNVYELIRSRVALLTSGATVERKVMKKTEIGKTKLEARVLEQKKLFQSVIWIIAIEQGGRHIWREICKVGDHRPLIDGGDQWPTKTRGRVSNA